MKRRISRLVCALLALACAGFQPTAILAHSPLEGPRSFHLGGFEVAAGQGADIRLDIAGGPGLPAILGVMEPVVTGAPAVSRCFEGTTSVPVSHSGIWAPLVRRGRDVTAGDRIGEVRGYDGRILETVVAPVSGLALYGLAGPPVHQGDSEMTIATHALWPAPHD
jgi:hypothetical protein